ncbi:MFS transporter [Leptospira sp. 2 VSF19]|uniref:MFS transporter n=1 Tax=Leptospira soteropolitanensis TaxID=2950025 RepID=A0AAW5VPN5_9LEPT|nr:MFS transporter [Leptospira soteropolitanensis]MCW7494141.1 MFS transporter [Leptospira soteropolitanensis]MCW7501593.1 MFS transporter [Leptospira soteropolitanensis]MCW7523987.1 MFS transporter [Leptospira soteropolitanensis]MCW7527852.1 MFS transporter [Leptospira soteropolitanensis]MCW7531563.1 MFS transporter [Leptospira soteropolitanensis]
MDFKFTPYHVFVVGLLAFLQFTVVLDFMILSPLGVLVMKELQISTQQFGFVVSAYAFSAGISGLLAAGFADRFDRKKLLLFFYVGFVIATFLCGIATNYFFLFGARILTGVFAGVLSSISFAIVADLFPLQVRGRVMGFIMTAFAASQVFGLPIGIFISNLWGWQSPFLMIAGISGTVGFIIFIFLKPLTTHLDNKTDTHALHHLVKTITQPKYLPAFLATTLLATGGFMLMPFGSAFSVHNLGVKLEDLPLVYMVTGVVSMLGGPLMGRLSDAIGKYNMFVIASAIAACIIIYYTKMEITPLPIVILVNSFLFVFVAARMISANALTSAVPELHDRGAFMAISSSIQQISGGIAASVAGLIVIQTSSGYLERYDILGYVVACAIVFTVILMYSVNQIVLKKHTK